MLIRRVSCLLFILGLSVLSVTTSAIAFPEELHPVGPATDPCSFEDLLETGLVNPSTCDPVVFGTDPVGFPVDPSEIHAGGVAKVFFIHFRNSEFPTFDGTVLCTVFGGPDDILPPPKFEYGGPGTLTSLMIDFSTIPAPGAPVLDAGQRREKDWVYAYVIINDEGDNAPIPMGAGARNNINQVNIGISSRLRTMEDDIPSPMSSTFGQAISAIGIVDAPMDSTTDPSLVLPGAGTGVFVNFAIGGEGCIPDVNRIGDDPSCHEGDHAPASVILFLTSPFGPGINRMALQGGLGRGAPVNDLINIPAPLTYPTFKCLDITVRDAQTDVPFPEVNGLVRIPPGTEINIEVTVENSSPPTGPPYTTNLPGGTIDAAGQVCLGLPEALWIGPLDQGPKDFETKICGPTAECPDLSRQATVIFSGIFSGERLELSPTIEPKPPYNLEVFTDADGRVPDGSIRGSMCSCPNKPECAPTGDGRFPVVEPRCPDCTLVLVGVPVLEIAKEVQLVCFDRSNPSKFELRPPMPTDSVAAPPCGVLRFTLTLENPGAEDLRDVIVTDCLPDELEFLGFVSPPGTLQIMDELGCSSGTPISFEVGSIPMGTTQTFVFDAVVKSSVTGSDLLTNLARARGVGVDSGLETDLVEDPATVDLQTFAATFLPMAGDGATVCVGQTIEATLRFTNTGEWTIDPIDLGTCIADPGLMILDQNPAPGTRLGPLGSGATFDVTLLLQGTVADPTQACVSCPVTFRPECDDPTDDQDCVRILEEDVCITVVASDINVTCLTDPPLIKPDTEFTFQYQVTNKGGVPFEEVTFDVVPDPDFPGLILVDFPAMIGPLGVGESEIVDVTVRSAPDRSGRQGALATATGNAAGFPEVCDDSEPNNECYLLVRPDILVDKKVQLVCFLDPDDEATTELRPPTPADEIDAPVCGLLRFTISVTNPTVNEALTEVRITDCLPACLEFRNNLVPSLATGGTPLDCPPDTVPIVFQLPDLAADGGSFVLTFDAIVRADAINKTVDNLAQTVARGATSDLETNERAATARVNVNSIAAQLSGLDGDPNPACEGDMVSFQFTLENPGKWPLIVDFGDASLDSRLTLDEQDPPAGRLSDPLLPGNDVSVTVTALIDPNTGGESLCVRLPVDVVPECTLRDDPQRCEISLEEPACVEIVDAGLTVVCLNPNPPSEIGAMITFQFRVTNTGSVPCEMITLDCIPEPDPGITIVDCPASIGALGPMESAVVDVIIQPEEGVLSGCATLVAQCTTPNPPGCLVTASGKCPVVLRIPTLAEWGLLLLAAGLGGCLVFSRRAF